MYWLISSEVSLKEDKRSTTRESNLSPIGYDKISTNGGKKWHTNVWKMKKS